MSADQSQVVIVGSGHAGVHTAASLRAEGWAGGITLLDEESHVPYERPPLSKEALKKPAGFEPPLLRKESFYGAKDIRRIPNSRAGRLDRDRQEVVTTDGQTFPYHRLVLATGARARPLAIPGNALSGVHYLRRRDEALALKEALAPGRRVVIVGAGYIGMEVAAAASALGCDVTVIEFAARAMSRVTSSVVSEHFRRLHEAQGVRFVFGAAVARIEGEKAATAVVTADGAAYPADVVVVGVGIIPNDQLAADAGLDCLDGILVDADGRTSDPHIYAAGDVARARRADGAPGLRLECIQSAVAQGSVVAASIAGAVKDGGEVPWFWTVQHDVRLQTAGLWHPDDDVVVRGAGGDGFSVLYLRQGRLAAVDTVNALQDFVPAKKLIAAGSMIDRAAATDPSTKLTLATL
ncbi:NAD(P)/FAD-dependent oxidoreductase [Sinomonas sp. B1-1]|uniref:NAD(P)/FAD-dependent oxidoreductase n=1 Tax=Sinomonas sp. B1-1 TaxID=3141454 RepID=UPI003D2C4082